MAQAAAWYKPRRVPLNRLVPLAAVSHKGYMVLRCRGRDTLTLSDALREEDLDAWSPILHRRRRIAGKRRVKMVEAPHAPGYVFLRSDQLETAINTLQAGRCPFFRLMYKGGKEVSVSSKEVDQHKEHSVMIDGRLATLLKTGTIAELKHESFGDMLVRVIGKRDGNNLVEDLEGRFKFVTRPWYLRPVSLAES